MSSVADFTKVAEARGDAVYFKAGDGEAVLKKFKKTAKGYAAEFVILADSSDNPEGETISQAWNLSWDSHADNLKSFLQNISRDPMPRGISEFAKTAVTFINEEQPLRGRVIKYSSVFKTKKDGTVSNFADVSWDRAEQTDAQVAEQRAKLE